MKEVQYLEYKMWKSFDGKIKDIENFLSSIDNQCDGDSRQVGYNIETVIAMKKEISQVLEKYKKISIERIEKI